MTIPILKCGFVRDTESRLTKPRGESLDNFNNEGI